MPTKVHLFIAMVFPVVMYRCESWTIKKAEHWRIDAFELRCWRRLLRVSRQSRSNKSILKEITPEYSLEGLMLKLKLQYFGYLMGRTDSLEKTLMLGKFEGRKRRGQQRMRWLDGITDLMDMSLVMDRSWWWTRRAGVLQSMGSQSRTQLSNWTELNWHTFRASLVAQMVKNLSASRETPVQSLGGEDSLEKQMTIHSSILAWRIPWTE